MQIIHNYCGICVEMGWRKKGDMCRYVSIRVDMCRYVSICVDTCRYVSIRVDTRRCSQCMKSAIGTIKLSVDTRRCSQCAGVHI
jgi:hypothetical protein